MRTKKNLLPLVMMFLFAAFAVGQDEKKIQKLFQDAIQAMGGDVYLNVTDMVSEGQTFLYNREGATSIPIKFNDYTKLPDKSRYELGNRKKERDITVFNLSENKGWILEGQKEVREATPEEMSGFRKAVKHSIESIFRFRYKDPDTELFYLGPGEGKEATLEIVKIIDSENDEVTIYFDRISKLPAKIEYNETDSRGIRYRIVDEFGQWHEIEGVRTPLRIDSYTNGRQTSLHFILDISYNNDLQDDFFAKPVPPK
jgi:hypothetical protein